MLQSSHAMLLKASAGGYAVGQFNINNLEWIRAILQAAERCAAPVILGVTGNACSYMGGLTTVRDMTAGMIDYLGITAPVALHLDHSSYDECLEAIGAGFTSVMFDGSKLPFAENLRLSRRLAEICEKRRIALEAELGSPAGEEDGISGTGEHANPQECAEIAATGITTLAASIGNIHGEYPSDWAGLDFPLLEEIRKAVNGLPLALHGGSGIPDSMLAKAISHGIAKINVNTECQIAFADAICKYFESGENRKPKGYNLQKVLAPGIKAIEELVCEKISFFGSDGKAYVLQGDRDQ